MGSKDQKNDKENKGGKAEAVETVTVPRQEFDALKARADERDGFYDRYVRAHAEF